MSDADHEMVVESAALRAEASALRDELSARVAEVAEVAAWRRAAVRLLAGPCGDDVATVLAAEGLEVSA
jgi:hypothetical protein